VVCPKAGLVNTANPLKSQTAVDIRIVDFMWFLLIEF
jgi:alpha-galactosidase/6-phospho-beta-glucosidase family protein